MNKLDKTTVSDALGMARAVISADRFNFFKAHQLHGTTRASLEALAVLNIYDSALAEIDRAREILESGGAADPVQSGAVCSACAATLPGAPTGFPRECVPCNRAVAAMARLDALMRRCQEDHHDLAYKDLQEVLGDYAAAPVEPVQRPGDCLPGGAR